jgi:hypothetical protein
MSLFDSLIQFLGSGLILAASDSLVVEAQNGPLRLSAFNGSGVLDFDPSAGHWLLHNGDGAQPIMSGINGVPGPNITLIGGSNVRVSPNPSDGTITIDASGSAGGITDVNGAIGPNISVVGSGGVRITTSGNIIDVAHNVVGYRQIVSGYTGNQVFTHSLNTTFIVPSFRAMSGPHDAMNAVFNPQFVKILNADQIAVRMSHPIDFEITLIGYKM